MATVTRAWLFRGVPVTTPPYHHIIVIGKWPGQHCKKNKAFWW